MRQLLRHILCFFIIPAAFTVAAVVNAVAGQIFLQDQVLSHDTTWSGEVVISGVIVVGRGVTLTIKPGTTIRFKRIDRNQDGIGDSEIRVLGRLLAQGTAEKKIRFVSAEENPAPKDWSFVLIFTSGRINLVSFCEFSHAFSGLQVHFSTAKVTNNTFTDNNEGLRFGRCHLLIENNLFRDNKIGIRFTRMEGPVFIRHNEVTRNQVGIFLVPSGQNIQDFFNPDRRTPWNTGHLTISGNNIHANSHYNLDLGAKQLWDLEISDNWWGTTDSGRIEESIFDRHRDPLLGRAIFTPFAKNPFATAGILPK